jgi:hypothetical protein
MTHVVDKVLPLLGAVDSDIQRQGAVEALASISEKLQFSTVPYIVLLVVPLLGEEEILLLGKVTVIDGEAGTSYVLCTYLCEEGGNVFHSILILLILCSEG